MWAAPNVGKIILGILTIKPLANYRDSLRVISWHRAGGRRSHPGKPTLPDVRKVPPRLVAMLPNTVGDGWTRTGRRRHDGESLPLVRTDLHIGVIAIGLVAIVPDGPRLRLVGDGITTGGRPATGRRRRGWDRAGVGVGTRRVGIRNIRPGRIWEANDNAAPVPTTAIAATVTPATTSMASTVPVCLIRIASWESDGHRVTKICRCCPFQKECRNGCYRCGLAHFRHLSREHAPTARNPRSSHQLETRMQGHLVGRQKPEAGMPKSSRHGFAGAVKCAIAVA